MKVRLGGAVGLERVAVIVLSSTLVVILQAVTSERSVAPRIPAPIPVHSEAVPDSVWETVVRRGLLAGSSRARDTMVLFSDYECPACAAVAPVLDSLRRHRPAVAILHRHFPLSNHPYAFEEALAVECAGKLGRLDEGQAAMHGRGGAPVDPARVAARLDLDGERFGECWRGGDASSAVEEDLALARSLGLARTPVVFFSGHRWSHVPVLDELLRLIPSRF